MDHIRCIDCSADMKKLGTTKLGMRRYRCEICGFEEVQGSPRGAKYQRTKHNDILKDYTEDE